MTLPDCTPPATRGIVSMRDVVEAIVRDDPLPNCCPPINVGGPVQFVRRQRVSPEEG